MWEVKAVGNATTARMGQVVPNNRLDVMSNLFHDGTNWMADDVSQPSVLYIQQIGEHDFYTCGVFPNPRGASLAKQVSITSTGTTITAGLVNTPLNASDLSSGTIPDARLSPNVALKNIDNQFIPQTLASTSIIKGTGAYLGWYDTAASVADTHNWRMLGYGDGTFWLEALNDANNVYQARFGFGRNNELYGALLDASSLNRGTVPLARLPAGIGGPSYEQGYFTPILGGTGGEANQVYAPGFQAGNYIKIGNFVHAGIYIQFTDCGQIFGDLVVKGLPFRGGGGSATHAATIGYMTNIASPGTKNPRRSIHGYMFGNSSEIHLLSGDDLNATDGNMIFMTGADVNIHTQITVSISYSTSY
jgi:hypothetical protein